MNHRVYCSAAIRTLCFGLIAALWTPFAGAQSDDEQPIELEGTTIIGDRELPIGLYISPWRSATPESGIDKPSRYLDVGTQPLDPEVFRRTVEYLDALNAAAAEQR